MKNKLKSIMHLSLEEVERMEGNGTLTESVARAYSAVWNWSTPRHGGDISRQHDVFWATYGREHYYRRINRVRTAFGFQSIGGAS